jgi:hypothetical protein
MKLFMVLNIIIAIVSVVVMFAKKAFPFAMNVAGGTVWNLPNFLGELIVTADATQTPLLAMSGGLNGVKETTNFTFPIDQEYSQTAASQPAISETASIAGPPTAISVTRSQVVNVCQIHQEQVDLSYAKLSNSGKLYSSGVLTAGQSIVPVSEADFQIAKALEKIQRDAEYSIIQGSYVAHTAVGTASKTRGLNEAATTTQAAGSATLTKVMIQKLLRDMYAAGAQFVNPVFVVNAFQKQLLSSLYAYAPMDRNVGGVNIKQIETDFGNVGVMLNRFQSTSVLGLYDMAFVSVVSCPVPGKGHMFLEPLGKTGASDKSQIYGQLGLDHGPQFMHGTITGLATS